MTRGEEECPESESDVKNSYVVIYSGSFLFFSYYNFNYHYTRVSSWMAQKTTSSGGTTMIDIYVYSGEGEARARLTTTD